VIDAPEVMEDEIGDLPALRSQRLAGKVAVISGGGARPSGVSNGTAMALLFGQHGAKVVVGDVDELAAEKTAASIRRNGGECSAVLADVTRASDCSRLIGATLEQFGRLDILVNNAGITGPSMSVVDISEEDWDRVLSVNVKSMMLTCKYAIPAIADGGSIINVSSVGALRWTERTAYAASKGAVLSLTTSLAGQHAGRGIRVNSILPGAVWTPVVAEEARQATGADTDAVERIRGQRRAQALLASEGTAWDVGYAALYLASDESRWMTGQALVIDGGATIARRQDAANV
jgi:NAD(P)-dependent dehydrogenase (short-subunit alcohol dehydrogenase family)